MREQDVQGICTCIGLDFATSRRSLCNRRCQTGKTFDADEPRRPTLTTTSGVRVPDNQNSITAGPPSAVLVDDFMLIEKLAMQNREPVPERVVDAKGSGASGKLLESCHGVDD
jgi:catalase